jgi:hypothetical protein
MSAHEDAIGLPRFSLFDQRMSGVIEDGFA